MQPATAHITPFSLAPGIDAARLHRNDNMTAIPNQALPSDLQRITTIGDSVFAVALTLLASGIRVPASLSGKSLEVSDLQPLLLDMGAVVMSFCVASVFWLSHWVHLRKALRSTMPFLISDLAVLLCIILLPLSTRVLSAGPLSTVSAAIYSANLLAASLALMNFRRQALTLSVPSGEAVPTTRAPRFLASVYSLTVHGLALVAAFFDPWISLALWICAFLTPLIERFTNRLNAGDD